METGLHPRAESAQAADSFLETPTEYAAKLAAGFASRHSFEKRRADGQFFTPPEIARFMASLAGSLGGARLLLDPGAGTGILACALCERLPRDSGPVHVDAFEADSELARVCGEALEYSRNWLNRRGVSLTFSVHRSDFVLENGSALTPELFDGPPNRGYDVAIGNPPYFKLRKNDPRAVAASAVVHGQPNIYALFMAIMANLLSPEGVMVTITPRSFATGDYFRKFRRQLFETVTPEAAHVFHSRAEAFRADDVLQENIILRSRRIQVEPGGHVEIGSSVGVGDLGHSRTRSVPIDSVLHRGFGDISFHVPLDATDEEVVRYVRQWPTDLGRLGLQVSTGPVVAFRAEEFLVEGPANGDPVAPLLWLQHVKQMSVEWPRRDFRKPQLIRTEGTPRPLLLPGSSYVVLRRFTAKEEPRRLIAAPLLKRTFPGEWIGLENHLNYICRRQGALTEDEAIGLAALLSSSLLDRYFRVSSGSTQVNASDLRALPLPPLERLSDLGEKVGRQVPSTDEVDVAVGELLGLPRALRSLRS